MFQDSALTNLVILGHHRHIESLGDDMPSNEYTS
jgi:hypothetical protein